ncbi:flagellar assembly protein FliH [Thaumasiovibrio sp. DFM-14]|uniref:flagellar assembly protein FliH n=1 Tax=Thaumasiovibrio sp. DFM-14 TaxID=3384792 RepID=UPI0039A023B8
MTYERRRGYLRVEPEQTPELARWDLPDYGEEELLPRDTAFNYDPSWQPAEPAPEVEQEVLAPLTAADLETIRQSAYEEGFAQGQEAGYQAGIEKGKPQGLEQGVAEGIEQGLAQGLEQGQTEIATQVSHLLSLVDKLAAPMAAVDEQVEQVLVEMVTHLTQELIRVELKTNPDIILRTVRDGIAALPISGRRTTIQVHPDDFQLLNDAYGNEGLAERDWQLIAEPGLQRGDVTVIAEDSQVDYLLEQRIKELLHHFVGRNGLAAESS